MPQLAFTMVEFANCRNEERGRDRLVIAQIPPSAYQPASGERFARFSSLPDYCLHYVYNLQIAISRLVSAAQNQLRTTNHGSIVSKWTRAQSLLFNGSSLGPVITVITLSETACHLIISISPVKCSETVDRSITISLRVSRSSRAEDE